MQAKRKLTALLLSLCMVLGMLPMTVFAAGGTTTSGLTYEINGESVTITGYTGNEASVVIPNEIEGKPVTAIGEKAFYQNYTLTSVEIPNSVTSIGTSAFHLCSNLTNVTFEEGSKLSSIGAGAFYWCTKLTDITIPDGVTSIGNSVFYKTGLQNINIPAGVTSIEEGAFWKCDKLESITFEGRTAPVLDGDVFFECTVLTAIHAPCGADGYTAANGWPEDKVQKREHLMAPQLRVPATCTTDGTIEHWRCALCGGYFLDEAGTKEISEEQIVEKATGHDWDEPVWNWSDDGKTAAVTFTCKRDEKHTAEPDVTVTQEVKTPATCTEKGVAVDTAKAVLDGKEYTSINENSAVEIAALGHKAEKVEGKAPTATEPGNIEYWYCDGCNKYYSDKNAAKEIRKADTVIAKLKSDPNDQKKTTDKNAMTDTTNTAQGQESTQISNSNPKTGDNSSITLWLALLLISSGTAVGVTVYEKKKKGRVL